MYELRTNILPDNIASISLVVRDCFFILNEYRNLADAEEVEITNVMEKYIYLAFKIELGLSLDLIPIMIENNDDESQNELLNFTFYEYMVFLNANIEHLKCFMRLIEYMKSINSKYYMPFTKNSKNIEKFVHKVIAINELQTTIKTNKPKSEVEIQYNDETISNWGCQYFSSLYSLCNKTVIDLQLANDIAKVN